MESGEWKVESGDRPTEDLEFPEEALDALEDELDLPLIKERLREFEETGEGIPWEQIKAERGL